MNRNSTARRVCTFVFCAALGITSLSACSTPDAELDETPAVQFSGTNCGMTIELTKIPSSVITLEQSSTETLLALGAADQMVGTAYLKSEIAPEYLDDYKSVPVLSDDLLTAEGLREAAPDFVYASFGAKFSKDGVGTREELAKLDVPTYVSNVDCTAEGDDAFDALALDLAELGEILGHQEKAAELIAEQKNILAHAADLQGKTKNLDVVYIYSIFEGVPYVAGNAGIPQAMSDAIGITNTFADVDEDWPQVPWEEIAARDPDILVLGDMTERGLPGDSAAEKLETIEAEAAVSKLTALQNGNIVELPAIELDASVRSNHAVTTFVEEIENLGITE